MCISLEMMTRSQSCTSTLTWIHTKRPDEVPDTALSKKSASAFQNVLKYICIIF